MISVRSIAADELSLLFRLFNYNNPDDMLAENTRTMNNGEVEIFGLFVDSQLIGELHAKYISDDERFAVQGRRAYLFAFRVHRDFQGMGYGGILVSRVLDILKEKGYSEFTIGVEDDNEIAKHIYLKHGFNRLIGRMSESYQGDSYEYNLYLKADD